MLIEDYLRPAAVKAGVLKQGGKVRFGFQDQRHSLASFLVRNGTDVKTVQKMLRHSHVSTTLGIYAHSMSEDRLAAQVERPQVRNHRCKILDRAAKPLKDMVARDGVERRRQRFQNSPFQCFQQLQTLPWDCQALENTCKPDGSWVIGVGDSEQITIGYRAPPSGDFEVVIMIEGCGPKRCIGWTEFYLKRITRRAPALRMGEGACRGCDYVSQVGEDCPVPGRQ